MPAAEQLNRPGPARGNRTSCVAAGAAGTYSALEREVNTTGLPAPGARVILRLRPKLPPAPPGGAADQEPSGP